jgi:glycosyltransferase involved in cell wall biosynthesis
LKIAIDTHFITSGHATGNRTYTSELVEAMIALNTSHDFILYAIEDHPYYRRFDGNPRVKTRYVLSSNGVVRNFYSIPRALSEDKPDLVHLIFVLPLFAATPSVLTVHDLYYVHQRDVGLYNRLIGHLTTWSIPRAGKVITISEYSRQDILDCCSVEPSHVIAIPLGTDDRFMPVNDTTAVRDKLGISRDYILYVGRTEDPRKNFATLIDAYAALQKKGQIDEQLVIAGRHGPGTEILSRKVVEYGLKDCILLPGIVREEDLAALLSGATMFVYVSSFEGFGLPVLEAMACGTPVITSSGTSLAEVAGDAAMMVTPGNVDELAGAINRLRSDCVLQNDLRAKGLERVTHYHWEATARSTLQVYEDVVEMRR